MRPIRAHSPQTSDVRDHRRSGCLAAAIDWTDATRIPEIHGRGEAFKRLPEPFSLRGASSDRTQLWKRPGARSSQRSAPCPKERPPTCHLARDRRYASSRSCATSTRPIGVQPRLSASSSEFLGSVESWTAAPLRRGGRRRPDPPTQPVRIVQDNLPERGHRPIQVVDLHAPGVLLKQEAQRDARAARIDLDVLGPDEPVLEEQRLLQLLDEGLDFVPGDTKLRWKREDVSVMHALPVVGFFRTNVRSSSWTMLARSGWMAASL